MPEKSREGFPIDEVADLIFGAVTDAIVTDQATKFLNSIRFSLATFDLLKGFGTMKNQLTSVPDKVSTTYGVIFDKK